MLFCYSVLCGTIVVGDQLFMETIRQILPNVVAQFVPLGDKTAVVSVKVVRGV